jgi:exosortase/archaeosortase family protein
MSTTIASTGGPPWFRRPEARFPLRFVALSSLMAASWAALQPLWPDITAGMATLTVWTARLCGLDAAAAPGAQVAFSEGHIEVFRFFISDGCTALPLLMIYAVAVLAYPASRSQHALGLAAGLSTLFVANLARLVLMGWVGINAPGQVDAIHEYWTQGSFLVLVGGGWFAWVWWIADGRERTTLGAPRLRTALGSLTRSTRLRRAARHVSVVTCVFAVIGLVGLEARGVSTWGLIVRAPLTVMGWLVGIRIPLFLPEHLLSRIYGPDYAALAAVMALFLFTPRVPWRTRARAAVLDGIPNVYAVQAGTGIVLILAARILGSTAPLSSAAIGTAGSISSVVNTLFLALHIGVPALAWHHWASRLDRSEDRPAPSKPSRKRL